MQLDKDGDDTPDPIDTPDQAAFETGLRDVILANFDATARRLLDAIRDGGSSAVRGLSLLNKLTTQTRTFAAELDTMPGDDIGGVDDGDYEDEDGNVNVFAHPARAGRAARRRNRGIIRQMNGILQDEGGGGLIHGRGAEHARQQMGQIAGLLEPILDMNAAQEMNNLLSAIETAHRLGEADIEARLRVRLSTLLDRDGDRVEAEPVDAEPIGAEPVDAERAIVVGPPVPPRRDVRYGEAQAPRVLHEEDDQYDNT